MKWFTSVFVVLTALSFTGCEQAPSGAGQGERPQVETLLSREGTSAAEPAVAKNSGGDTFVVYVEHSEKNADVVLQRIDAAGRAGARVRVNPNAGEATAWKGDPPTIAVSADNSIFVGWTRKYADGAKGTDLVISVSRDAGQTFAEPVKVNDDDRPASHGMHSLAIGGDGRVLVAWLDERNIKPPSHDMSKMGSSATHHEAAEPNSEVFFSYSADGGKTFSPNQKIAENVCPCCKTSLLAAADGTVYTAWRQVLEGDHRHIAVASSRDAGASFSKYVIVSDDKWQISACPVSGAAMASSAPGTLDVLWYTAGEAGQAGIYFARSQDYGMTFGGRLLVSNEASGGTPVLVQRDGKSSAIFAAKDGGMITASWAGDPTRTLTTRRIAQAKYPAAVHGVTAFVKDAAGRSAVWASVDSGSLSR